MRPLSLTKFEPRSKCLGSIMKPLTNVPHALFVNDRSLARHVVDRNEQAIQVRIVRIVR